MKEKLQALDELIDLCEQSMARPYKSKRMSLAKKPEESEEPEFEKADEASEDSVDKKAKLLSMLDEMDEEELIRAYSKLEG